MRLLKIWALLISAYAVVVAILALAPLLGGVLMGIIRWLDSLTLGYAGSTLLIFVLIGLAATVIHLAQAIRVRAMRQPPSAIHICTSTMFASIFGGNAERDAREILASFRASLEPHVILLEPTDKNVDNVVIKEVRK